MKILNASKNMDTADRMRIYRLTDPNTTQNMKMLCDLDGIESLEWVHVEDVDSKTGEMVEKIFIRTPNGVYATISKSFIRQFSDFNEGNAADEELASFQVIERETKAGRKCILFSPLSITKIGGEIDD